jgi:hypothetical protein
MHSCTFSGEIKLSATFIHDCPRTKKYLTEVEMPQIIALISIQKMKAATACHITPSNF